MHRKAGALTGSAEDVHLSVPPRIRKPSHAQLAALTGWLSCCRSVAASARCSKLNWSDVTCCCSCRMTSLITSSASSLTEENDVSPYDCGAKRSWGPSPVSQGRTAARAQGQRNVGKLERGRTHLLCVCQGYSPPAQPKVRSKENSQELPIRTGGLHDAACQPVVRQRHTSRMGSDPRYRLDSSLVVLAPCKVPQPLGKVKDVLHR